mmetsp:Transcript_15243/g.47567  ORF Transcript_15243/g.47567 Transcript_15243/m.47567 type:complete len:244 (-) Transcript_15243:725-1456(-)
MPSGARWNCNSSFHSSNGLARSTGPGMWRASRAMSIDDIVSSDSTARMDNAARYGASPPASKIRRPKRTSSYAAWKAYAARSSRAGTSSGMTPVVGSGRNIFRLAMSGTSVATSTASSLSAATSTPPAPSAASCAAIAPSSPARMRGRTCVSQCDTTSAMSLSGGSIRPPSAFSHMLIIEPDNAGFALSRSMVASVAVVTPVYLSSVISPLGNSTLVDSGASESSASARNSSAGGAMRRGANL